MSSVSRRRRRSSADDGRLLLSDAPVAAGPAALGGTIAVVSVLVAIAAIGVSVYGLGRITGVEDTVADLTGMVGAPGTDGTDGVDGVDGVDGAGISFPNLLRVDGTYGNDTTGAPGGVFPYRTISAALLAAAQGNVVFVAPGTYEETLTIPTGVAVVGMADEIVTICRTNLTAPTTLVSMSAHSALRGVKLLMTSSAPVELVAISLGANAAGTSHVEDLTISVTNTAGGIANTVGVYSNAASSLTFVHNALRNIRMFIEGDGGTTRGILLDTNAHELHAREIEIFANGSGTAIAAEVNVAGGVLFLHACELQGATADVSRTQGTLRMSTSKLVTPSANGLSFTPETSPSLLTFADPGSLPSGTRYLYPGVQGASSNEIFVALPGPTIAISLSVRYRTAAVLGRVDTYTVRKNGVDTPLVLSINGTATSAVTHELSANFVAGDSLSLKVVGGAGSNPADTIVVVGLY